MGSAGSRDRQHNSALPHQPSSFERIGNDATRSVMQCLDRTDLLHFAHCSRQLFHAADVPRVWSHVTPVSYLPDSLRKPPAESSPYCLLPHQPLHLRIAFERATGSARPVSSLLQKLTALAAKRSGSASVNLFALDTRDPDLSPVDLVALLSHPLLQQLRSVAVHSGPLAAVTALPQLASLHVSAPRLDSAELAGALAAAPLLTSLHLVDGAHEPLVAVASSCRSLAHLSLLYPQHGGFRSFFTQPHICSTLQSLRLAELDCASSSRQKVTRVPAAEYRAIFSALVALRSVYLRRVFLCDLILEPLACAPALRSIVVETRGALLDRWGNFQDDLNPTADTLLTLMRAKPKLEVSLLLFEVAAADGPLFDLREKLRLRYLRMEDELRAVGCVGFRFCSTTEKQAARVMPQFALCP